MIANKTFLVILLLNFVFYSFELLAQERFILYFKDKGKNEQEFAKTTIIEKNEALKYISERSYLRRLKTLPKDKIIDWRDIPLEISYIDSLKKLGIEIKYKLKWFNAVSCYLNENQLNKVRSLSFISKVEKARTFLYKKEIEWGGDYHMLPKKTDDNNLNYGLSFNQISLTDVLEIHRVGIIGENVIIGVLDTGFDWQTHEALKTRDIIAEWDFVNNDSITRNQPGDPPGQHNHGTLCFSVIGGFYDGKLIGVSYGSKFVLAKTENIASETRLEEEAYAAALEWMDSIGVDVTTSSLGYNIFDNSSESYSYSDMNGNTAIVTKAANIAFEKGILVFTSAGNEGTSSWKYITAPADGFNIIAVGAVRSDLSIASFSSRGPTYDGRIKPDVCALGVGVYGATAGNVSMYGSASGTSLSCPLAAGVGALLLSAFPHLSNVQARDIILKTSSQYNSPDNVYGYGIISAKKTMEYPNVQKINGRTILNKFFAKDSIASVYFVLRNSEYNDSSSLNKINKNFYQADISFYSFLGEIKFIFRIEYENGRIEYIPSNNTLYTYDFGDLTVNIKEIVLPEKFELSQNYPNPFNLNTTIQINVPVQSNVSVIVTDIYGRVIKKIFNDNVSQGQYVAVWDGLDYKGNVCSSGVYFYHLQVNNKILIAKKMILLK